MAFKANLEKDEVMFLYRFIKGECPMSFGLNVARMAGIPPQVLALSKKKAEEFSAKLNLLTMRLKMEKQRIGKK